MFGLLTKKRFDEEIVKIKSSFRQTKKDIRDLNDKIVSKSEINLIMENAILKVQSVQYSEPITRSSKKKHYEKVMTQKALKNRPEVIKIAIKSLIERDMNTTAIFNIIVNEKNLVGKTQFYHYLSLVRNELRTGLRPELRTKQTN